MSVTVEMIPGIIEEAKAEAFKAADQFFNKELVKIVYLYSGKIKIF